MSIVNFDVKGNRLVARVSGDVDQHTCGRFADRLTGSLMFACRAFWSLICREYLLWTAPA